MSSSSLNTDTETRMRDSASVTAMLASRSRRAVSPGGGGRNATIGRRAVAGWGQRALRPSLAGAGHLPLSLEPARTASKKTPRCRHESRHNLRGHDHEHNAERRIRHCQENNGQEGPFPRPLAQRSSITSRESQFLVEVPCFLFYPLAKVARVPRATSLTHTSSVPSQGSPSSLPPACPTRRGSSSSSSTGPSKKRVRTKAAKVSPTKLVSVRKRSDTKSKAAKKGTITSAT